MDEYQDINIDLLGKKAKILSDARYCKFLHGVKGIIESVNDKMFLRFDKLAYRHKDDNMPMSGVYLSKDSYILI